MSTTDNNTIEQEPINDNETQNHDDTHMSAVETQIIENESMTTTNDKQDEHNISNIQTLEEAINVEKTDDEKQQEEDETESFEASGNINKSEFLNPRLFQILESKSRKLAESFIYLSGSLQSTLHATSGMTNQYMEVYQKSVFNTCDTVDEDVKTMNEFVQKCEELNQQLKQARVMYHDIKKLRNTVDGLDAVTQEMYRQKLKLK